MRPIDVSELLDSGSWAGVSKLVAIISALAIVFDGFDISIVGFAIPSMVREWGLNRAAFAPLVVIGLAGMTLGASTAGFIADRIGRRVALFCSVLLFGLATTATAFSSGLLAVELLRVLAAAGIGGALPNAATLSAEFTPFKRRAIAVMSTIVCVPLGGALAGSVAARVLPVAGWRTLFLIGGISPLVLCLAIWLLLPESPRYLTRQAARWGELRGLLARLGHSVPEGSAFMDSRENQPGQKMSLDDLLGRPQRRDTLALWLAFFSCMINIYLCFSWLPSLLASRGFDQAAASHGLEAYNYGGVAGVLFYLTLINRWGSRPLTLFGAAGGALSAMLLLAVGIATGTNHLPIIACLGIHGFFVNSVQTSLYALGVHIYPTRVRATGLATGTAVGRVGGMLSAWLGPAIIQGGKTQFFEILTVAMVATLSGAALLRNHIPRVAAVKVLK